MSDERARQRLQEFRELAADRVSRIGVAWIRIEAGAAGADAIDQVKREFHTLKGEASLMGYPAAARVAHALEELVHSAVVAGGVDSAVGDLVLRGLDDLTATIEGDGDADARAAAFERVVAGDPEPVAPVLAPSAAVDVIAAPTGGARAPELAVRVTPAQLDRMRAVIGEMLLARLRVASAAGELDVSRTDLRRPQPDAPAVAATLGAIEARLRDDAARMANLINALEDLACGLRMVPIGRLFDEYPRAARELGRQLGRDVALVVDGHAVEADRDVVEALREPLLHLVRNAVDHGIEPPAERERLGKPPVGEVSLRAEVSGDVLRVEMRDDGAGIDVARVRDRALELGLLDAPSARVLADDQILSYLFASGFSTRTAVTSVSGRGVGLDVVKSAVEGLGGSVSVTSERGVGTAFHLAVPITASITSVLLFRVGDEHYALPATAVVALVEAGAHPTVDSIDGPALRLDGDLALEVPLPRLLDASGGREQPERGGRVIIARAGRGTIALTGTRDHVEREAVVLPTGDALPHAGLVRGGVGLEDGTVSLVLDPAAVRDAARRRAFAWTTEAPSRTESNATVLVAEDSPIMRDVVAESLRSYGLRVLEAGDGAEALDVLAGADAVDLVVTDLEMPRMDGFELIQRLRERGGPRIPAVVVSTRGSDADKMAAMKVGADAYVVKSEFSREGLWATVSRFV